MNRYVVDRNGDWDVEQSCDYFEDCEDYEDEEEETTAEAKVRLQSFGLHVEEVLSRDPMTKDFYAAMVEANKKYLQADAQEFFADVCSTNKPPLYTLSAATKMASKGGPRRVSIATGRKKIEATKAAYRQLKHELYCLELQKNKAMKTGRGIITLCRQVKEKYGEAEEARFAQVDTYFTPNTIKGRRNDANVVRFNSFFLDFDAGSGDGNQLKSLEEVAQYKADLWDKIEALPQYSAAVDTRNGLQLYWIIAEEAKAAITDSRWREVQNSLLCSAIALDCGVDVSVRTPAHLMRPPGTLWVKAHKGDYDSHYVTVSDKNDIRWTPDGFEKELSLLPSSPMPSLTHKNLAARSTSSKRNISKNINSHVEAIRNMDASFFQGKFSRPRQLLGWDEAKSYIKTQIDIGEFIGAGACAHATSLTCVLHDDHSPSARILPPNEKYNSWMYHCLAGCTPTIDIIGLVQALTGARFKEARHFLFKAYNVEIRQKRIRVNREKAREQNMEIFDKLLKTNKDFGKRMRPLRNMFKAILDVAAKCAQMTDVKNEYGSFVFPASKTYLAKMMGQQASKVFCKINLLTALGLIEKVPDTELPVGIIDRDRRFNELLAGKYGEDFKTVQYYRLPSLNKLSLQLAAIRLKRWIKAGGQVKKISCAYLAGIFGENVAALCYVKPLTERTAIAKEVKLNA